VPQGNGTRGPVGVEGMKLPAGKLTPSLCESGTLIAEPCVTSSSFNEIIRVPQSANSLQKATCWHCGIVPLCSGGCCRLPSATKGI